MDIVAYANALFEAKDREARLQKKESAEQILCEIRTKCEPIVSDLYTLSKNCLRAKDEDSGFSVIDLKDNDKENYTIVAKREKPSGTWCNGIEACFKANGDYIVSRMDTKFAKGDDLEDYEPPLLKGDFWVDSEALNGRLDLDRIDLKAITEVFAAALVDSGLYKPAP